MGASSCSGKTGPEGDPGAVILSQLSAVRAAVPSNARRVRTMRHEPVFAGSCTSTQPDVTVVVMFMSSKAVSDVEGQVGGALAKAGWRKGVSSGPGKWYTEINGQKVLAENYVERWTKRLYSGQTEGATLQVGVPVGSTPHASLQWLLGARAASMGGPVKHCGEGIRSEEGNTQFPRGVVPAKVGVRTFNTKSPIRSSQAR